MQLAGVTLQVKVKLGGGYYLQASRQKAAHRNDFNSGRNPRGSAARLHVPSGQCTKGLGCTSLSAGLLLQRLGFNADLTDLTARGQSEAKKTQNKTANGVKTRRSLALAGSFLPTFLHSVHASHIIGRPVTESFAALSTL